MNVRTISLLAVGLFVAAGFWCAAFPRTAVAIVVLAMAAAIRIYQTLTRRAADGPAVLELEAARALLAKGDGYAALRTASAAVAHATTTATRDAALTTLARAALSQGYPGRAKAALVEVRRWRALDLPVRGAVHAANGDRSAAIRALDAAGIFGTLNREAVMLLIDLQAKQGRLDLAAAVATQSRELLGVDGCRTVLRAVWAAGEYGAAAKLASALFRMTRATEDAVTLLLALANVHDGAEAARTLDEFVGLFRGVDEVTDASSLVAKLRAHAGLSSGARTVLDRMHRRFEAAD